MVRRRQVTRGGALLLGAALLLAAVGFWLVDGFTSDVRVDSAKPAGMGSSGADAPTPAASTPQRRELVVPAAPKANETDAGLASTPTVVPKPPEPELTFDSKSILAAGLDPEIAAAMQAAAEVHWRSYLTSKAVGDTDMVRPMAYLFAVWPELGEWIKANKVGFKTAPASFHAGDARPHVLYTSDRDAKTLTVCFRTSRWSIDIVFDAASGPKGLFERIFADGK